MVSVTKFKTAIQHADTLLANIGSASVPTEFIVLQTDVGARTVTGAAQTIQDAASTGMVVRIGDIVKYINLFIQVCARSNVSAEQNRVGWLEWAFVMVKESETVLPITNLGVQTLGNVATNMFRNECIYTGFVPVSTSVSNGQTITIKVPRFKQKIRIGDEWRFIVAWRSSNSADTATDTQRIILSTLYKVYS